jgi:cap1 methyltransferase
MSVKFFGPLQSVFDELQPEELRRARTRSNPFETIRGAFFLNRAAMKMANMDKVFDFMFTKPKGEHNVSIAVFSTILPEISNVQT